MIAALVHGADRIDGRHAAGKDSRGNSTFKRREIPLQSVAGWIGDAGILVAAVLAEFVLDVGRSGVDGDGYGAGGWIRLLAIVDGASGKTPSLFVGRWSLAVRHRRCSFIGLDLIETM